MNVPNLLLIISALLAALVLVFFQYFYKQRFDRDTLYLSILRMISLFCIFLLLINPEFESKQSETQKPTLFLGIDNSLSIAHLGATDQVNELREKFLMDADIMKRFDLSLFQFGGRMSLDTMLTYDRKQTNIFQTIEDVNALENSRISPVVLVTDGNQTYGNNYRYIHSKNPIFPIAIGDTVLKPDIKIDRINVNAYATLNNIFPVEIFLSASGGGNLRSSLIVERKGVELYRSNVMFNDQRSSAKITFHLPADSSGMQIYNARLLPFKGEWNVSNNRKNFGVEILDEQAKVAVVYHFLHPDLGMIKRSIESNKQRNAILIQIDELEQQSSAYDQYILYQPDKTFESTIELLKQDQLNLFIISGSHTDWEYLNSAGLGFSKTLTGVEENVQPVFQNSFSAFYVEDLGYSNFPPLRSLLGEITFSEQHDIILNKSIEGIDTGIPLVSTFVKADVKGVLWLGEHIWKWRAHCFESDGTFEKFDQFFNSLIQFLQLSDREKELDLFYKPVFYAGEPVSIRAKKYDSNLQATRNSRLTLTLKDSTNEVPFYLKNGAYESQLKDVREGSYSFEVRDLDTDQIVKGSFVVEPFSIEQENSIPDLAGLTLLASNSGGQMYNEDQFELLKSYLLENEQFKAIEKERTKLISLMDWKWLLGLIVLSLSLEWLLRKYRGLI